jgi:pyridoxal phosphate enzyme (YggS family)
LAVRNLSVEAPDTAGLAAKLAIVKERVRQAAQRARRDPTSVTLVAVSKLQSPAAIAALIAAGQLDFGENRIEEAGPKMMGLQGHTQIRWHMIGHVQGRKARDVAAAGFTLVHSVDTLRLAERLSRQAQAAARRQAVLLECNVSGEANKAGFAASESEKWTALLPDFKQIADLPGLQVRGLMTMAPQVAMADAARPFFERLAGLRDFLALKLPGQSWEELSMGMTDDFEVAIGAGATIVRVGRAIFGQ